MSAQLETVRDVEDKDADVLWCKGTARMTTYEVLAVRLDGDEEWHITTIYPHRDACLIGSSFSRYYLQQKLDWGSSTDAHYIGMLLDRMLPFHYTDAETPLY